MSQVGEQAVDERQFALLACDVVFGVGRLFEQIGQQSGKHFDQPAAAGIAGETLNVGLPRIAQLQREFPDTPVEQEIVEAVGEAGHECRMPSFGQML
nr:hypothetical protein [Azoarcus sp. DN11]